MYLLGFVGRAKYEVNSSFGSLERMSHFCEPSAMRQGPMWAEIFPCESLWGVIFHSPREHPELKSVNCFSIFQDSVMTWQVCFFNPFSKASYIFSLFSGESS